RRFCVLTSPLCDTTGRDMASSSSNSPCAACKFLRRKCTVECVFAPYFPPEEPQKFVNVHKIFGASNVTKLLNDLAPHQRDDAVNSLAYEAEARLKDPVYGCVGAISVLQRQIQLLQKELAAVHADLLRYTSAQGSLSPIPAPAPAPSPSPSPSPAPYLSKLHQNLALLDFPQVMVPLHLQQPQLTRQQVVELAIRLGGSYDAGGLTNIHPVQGQTQIMYPPTPPPHLPTTTTPATGTNRASFGHLPTPSQYSHH
ncbi:hypothetical protein KI387_044374, partial [Taxus chinensis]